MYRLPSFKIVLRVPACVSPGGDSVGGKWPSVAAENKWCLICLFFFVIINIIAFIIIFARRAEVPLAQSVQLPVGLMTITSTDMRVHGDIIVATADLAAVCEPEARAFKSD